MERARRLEISIAEITRRTSAPIADYFPSQSEHPSAIAFAIPRDLQSSARNNDAGCGKKAANG